MFLGGHPLPLPRGETTAFPQFRDTPFDVDQPNLAQYHIWGGACFQVSHSLRFNGTLPQRSSILCLTQEDQIWRGDTCGGGRFGG